MRPIHSKLEDHLAPLHGLEKELKPLGFAISSNWDYDQGSFDLKLADANGTCYYLRLPFYAVRGSLDDPGVYVRLGKPFMLGHKYQAGFDEDAGSSTIQGALTPFQPPEDPDTDVPDVYVSEGQMQLRSIEQLLFPWNQ